MYMHMYMHTLYMYVYVCVYVYVVVGTRALSAGVSVQLVAHGSRATNYGAIQTTGLGKPT